MIFSHRQQPLHSCNFVAQNIHDFFFLSHNLILSDLFVGIVKGVIESITVDSLNEFINYELNVVSVNL
jgi:hypothetical protein